MNENTYYWYWRERILKNGKDIIMCEEINENMIFDLMFCLEKSNECMILNIMYNCFEYNLIK